jgi:hypothetical protein
MQNFTAPKLFALAISITFFFFVTSCINDVDNSQPTRFQVGMEILNFDSTFTVGEDEMSIQSVGFVVDNFRFETGGEPILLNSRVTPFTFETQPTATQNPATLVGGPFPADVSYNSLGIEFPKAPEGGSGNFDQRFYGEDGKRYTIVAEGTYNDSLFTYRSERPVENNFPVNISTVPADDAFFTFLIQTDLQRWFLGGDGLLDPAVSENSAQINDQIGGSFFFEQDSAMRNQ